jgi:hypothetical protein
MANLIRRGGGKIVKLIESASDPAAVPGEAQLYAKDSGGTTKLFMQDGAGTVAEIGSGGGGGSGSLSAIVGVSGGVNFSTLGTIDWFYPTANAATAPRTVSPSSARHKRYGEGFLVSTFDWMPAGLAASSNSSTTWSTTASDDSRNSALNTTSVFGMNTTSNYSGWGFKFSVPSRTTTQVIRIYTQTFNAVKRLSCKLSDGSAAPVTVEHDDVSNVNVIQVWTVTFSSAEPCFITCWLENIARASVAQIDVNMFLAGITIGTT